MKRNLIIGIGLGVLAVGALVAALTLAPNQSTPRESNPDQSSSSSPGAEDSAAETQLMAGRYVEYSPESVAAEGYSETILFFHAPWCPECRAFEVAIEASAIPEGVQILKVDYDSSSNLKQQYGVTLQSTFVSVADDGAEVSQWTGYGKDKSVDAILENT